jgi:threonine synthase
MWDFGLSCTRCGKQRPIDDMLGKCECGGTLLVEYDLEKINRNLPKAMPFSNQASMWRYHHLLPIKNKTSIVSLGEGLTPLLRIPAWEKRLSLKQLWVKREEQNPTGSFKARGFSVAVSLLNERGIKKVAVPSNGNAASALAAYAARAGMEAFVFIPKDCPGIIAEECITYGANTYLIDGLIHDAGLIIEQGKKDFGWFNVGTLKEPGRVEGKKTMGLELAEQLKWALPDIIVYPTGGGSGIIGMWKAFRELKALGLINGDLPRLISVQEEGCQPIVEAMNPDNTPSDRPKKLPSPNPTGLRVPLPPDKELILSILRETNGAAIAVTKEEIHQASKAFGTQGISSSPEGAATFAALLHLKEKGLVYPQDRVVLFNTSHALKYLPWNTTSVPIIQNYSDLLRIQAKTNS